MFLVDIILLIILVLGILDGVRKGGLKSFVSFFGSILVFFLSWTLKGSLANVLIHSLPQLGGNGAISVLIYYILSFIILLIVFSIIYNAVLKITNVIEKVMDATIVLGLVSRILGGLFGFVKTYLFMFIVLFIMSIFNLSFLNNSKVNNYMLEKTPLLAPLIEDAWTAVKDVYEANNPEEAIKTLFEKNIINEKNFNNLMERIND